MRSPLISPPPDESENGASSRRVVVHSTDDVCVAAPGVQPTAPLVDVFAYNLRRTEELALAAQRHRRTIEDEVAALRAADAELRIRLSEDEAAAATSTRYLDARVYVHALRAAEADMLRLHTILLSSADISSSRSISSPSRLHALRNQLESAADGAVRRRRSVEAELAEEEKLLRSLDESLALLQTQQ